MKKVVTILIILALIAVSCTERRYPFTKKRKVQFTHFGHTITEHYSWLADTNLRATKKWIDRQKRYSHKYISGISFRDSVSKLLDKIWYSNKYTCITTADSGFYFVKRDEYSARYQICYTQNQTDTTIIFEPDLHENSSIVKLYPGADRNHIAYIYNTPETENLNIDIVDVSNRSKLTETINNVTSDKIAWYRLGFFYSAINSNNRCNVLYHKLYSNKRSDVQHSPNDNSEGLTYTADIVHNNKYLIIYSGKQNSKNSLYIKNLEQDSPIFNLTEDNRSYYKVIGAEHDQLYVLTDHNSNKREIVRIDLTKTTISDWVKIITPDRFIIKDAIVSYGHIVLNTIEDGIGNIKVYDTSGNYISTILPDITGSVSELKTGTDGNKILYSLNSYIQPKSLYMADLKTLHNTLIYTPKVNFPKAKYEVTPLPVNTTNGEITLLLVHKRAIKYGIDLPVILHPISGEQLNNIHKFDNKIIYWIQRNGVYAIAAIDTDIKDKTDINSWIKSVNRSTEYLGASIELLHEKNISNEKTLALYAENKETIIVCNVINKFSEQFAAVTLKDGLYNNSSAIKQMITKEANKQMNYKANSVTYKNLISVTPQFNTSDNITFPATFIITTSDKYKSSTFSYLAKIQGMKRSSVPKIMINYNHQNIENIPSIDHDKKVATDFLSFVHKNFKSKP
jgi:protease II